MSGSAPSAPRDRVRGASKRVRDEDPLPASSIHHTRSAGPVERVAAEGHRGRTTRTYGKRSRVTVEKDVIALKTSAPTPLAAVTEDPHAPVVTLHNQRVVRRYGKGNATPIKKAAPRVGVPFTFSPTAPVSRAEPLLYLPIAVPSSPTPKIASLAATKPDLDSDDSGDESAQVAAALVGASCVAPAFSPPAKVAPQATLPTPIATPTRPPHPRVSTSLKLQASPSSRDFEAVESDADEEQVSPVEEKKGSVEMDIEVDMGENSEEEAMDVDERDEELSDDELMIPPSPVKTPRKNAPKSSLVTPKGVCVMRPESRSASSRIRALPAERIPLTACTANLRAVLVGYQNDAGKFADGSDADLDKDGAVIATPSKLPRSLANTSNGFGRALVAELVSDVGSRLYSSHIALVQPETPIGGWDKTVVKDYPTLEGLGKWEKQVRYAVEGVVEKGVGNCLVLLGPRGVGKSLIVERSLDIVAAVHGKGSFIPVRLNGLAQTTDRLVMKEIARQLCSQGAMDEGGDFGSHAATMTTLLRLLEPPASDSTSPSASAPTITTGETPVVFIVDEFDLFALHPRQSFLYCLLDIVQGNKRRAGVGVIGISSRTDCLSVLEKRVRSRCQSQVLQMAPDNDLKSFVSLARSLLRVDPVVWAARGTPETRLSLAWNAEVDAFLEDGPVELYLERLWKLHGNSSTVLRQAIIHLYQQIEWNVKHSPADTISLPRLSVDHLLPASSSGRDNFIQGLTILELSVCVAAKHLLSNTENTFNLEMLYDVYSQHLARGRSGVATKGFSKNAFAMALDRLRMLEVMIPTTGKPSAFISPSIASNHKMWRFVPWASTLDEEINGRDDVPQPLRRWCKNWLG